MVIKWWPSSKKPSRLARMAKWPTFFSIRCRVFWVFSSGWGMAWVFVWVVGLGVPYNPLSWWKEMWQTFDQVSFAQSVSCQCVNSHFRLFGVVYPPPESGARFTSSWRFERVGGEILFHLARIGGSQLILLGSWFRPLFKPEGLIQKKSPLKCVLNLASREL